MSYRGLANQEQSGTELFQRFIRCVRPLFSLLSGFKFGVEWQHGVAIVNCCEREQAGCCLFASLNARDVGADTGAAGDEYSGCGNNQKCE